jgi:predicted dehydrogenase
MRMAVVGCGDIGLANARAVAAAGNAELQLCVDQEARLAEAAALVGGRAATSLDEAFDPGQVDAVVLCVPHDQHGPLAVRAAEAGLHVIVEKPLAVDYAGARRAADAAAAAGVALTTCFPYRYESHVVAARAAAAAGALGEVQGATVVFHADKAAAYWLGGFSGRSTSTWRLQRSRAGGGVFIMNVTHYLDLLRVVGGVEPERVTAFCRDGAADVEDGIAVAIALSGGGVATVVASATTPGAPSNRFEIWGSDGTIRLEPEPEVYTRRALAGITTGVWNQLPPPDDLDVRAVFVERFVTSVRAGTEPDVSVADSLAVQRLVEATYRSAREGRTVALVEIDGPAPAG